jgi:hypothetical protein
MEGEKGRKEYLKTSDLATQSMTNKEMPQFMNDGTNGKPNNRKQ